jgi:hypothetical protein
LAAVAATDGEREVEMKMRMLLVFCATLALTVGAATATAGNGNGGHGNGGNSANAKKCQKGGWKTLYRSDGTPFKNQGACVSYAAKGGTLTAKTQSQLDCEALGGTFQAATFPTSWTCTGIPFSAFPGPFAADCATDGFTGGAEWVNGGLGPPEDPVGTVSCL